MAARVRKELGVEVQMIHGRYGEFKVLVDGVPVVDAGLRAIVGLLPTAASVVKVVGARLAEPPPAEPAGA